MIKEITNKDLIQDIIDMFPSLKLNENNPFNFYLGYYLDDLVGFINYSIIYDRCEINYIGVIEKYRNKKIGSALLEFLFKKLNSCSNITLEVNINNIVAINLYKKYGFNIVSIRKNYYGNEDAYLMLKELGD